MKNGRSILLLVIALSVSMVLGVFIGRNVNSGHVSLSAEDFSAETRNSRESMDYRLDINTATKSQLMELPGIGEVMAERIVAYRTEHGMFSSIEEIQNVPGIKRAVFDKIKEQITAGR